MFLKNINLTNFRNFSKLNLEFNDVTLLIGNNAQGKSNLLESIYFLATTKSLRVEKDSQLIKEGEDYTIVSGKVADKDESIDLEIAMQLKEEAILKRIKVNGIPRRGIDYIGHLIAVLFSPEDINLVAGPPALRRWHIDMSLAQVDRVYKQSLTTYHEVILARNKILKRIKEGMAKNDELDFWTQKALESGKIVSEKRAQFFDFLNTAEKNLGAFEYEYQPNVISEDRLIVYRSREIAAAASLIGPHRDDFIFKLHDQDLAIFGSRGEARSAVLDLKLTELEYFHQLAGSQPILLLDDVFAELDDVHRRHVISVVSKQQTIITAVANETIPEGFLKTVKVFKIENRSAINLR